MIIACKECNGKVSTTVPNCPHCGASMGQKGTPVRKRPGARRPVGQAPEGASTIFVLGLLGLLVCGILGIFAWVQGNAYEAKCHALKVKPEGMAVAGKVLGMIATILMGLGLVVVPLLVFAGAAAG